MESQNHRMFWVREDLKDYLLLTPLLLFVLSVLNCSSLCRLKSLPWSREMITVLGIPTFSQKNSCSFITSQANFRRPFDLSYALLAVGILYFH